MRSPPHLALLPVPRPAVSHHGADAARYPEIGDRAVASRPVSPQAARESGGDIEYPLIAAGLGMIAGWLATKEGVVVARQDNS